MSLRRRDAHGRLDVLSRQGLVSCATKRNNRGLDACDHFSQLFRRAGRTR